ncbi:hypothetical protein OK016_29900 [Vibrio chagasii]|nr:hypothetical protein [Vibrio chagasii]
MQQLNAFEDNAATDFSNHIFLVVVNIITAVQAFDPVPDLGTQGGPGGETRTFVGHLFYQQARSNVTKWGPRPCR